MISFVIAHGIGDLIGGEETGTRVVREGVAGFMYLEVLDSSFSFDGVIGAFALSNNIFLIALGLGVGAAYIREMTLVLLKKGTLAQYRYLEHGAFWAIGALATIMFLGVKFEVPGGHHRPGRCGDDRGGRVVVDRRATQGRPHGCSGRVTRVTCGSNTINGPRRAARHRRATAVPAEEVQMINLSKGGRVNLSKEAPGTQKFRIGLGWDANATDTGTDFDLDVSVFQQVRRAEQSEADLGSALRVLQQRSAHDGAQGHLHPAGRRFPEARDARVEVLGVVHSGDNRTGSGDGDDEVIFIDMTKLAADIEEISVVVTIDQAEARRQNFGRRATATSRSPTKCRAR